MKFFGKLEIIEKELKTTTKQTNNTSHSSEVTKKKQQYILEGMQQALIIEKYTLIIEDIANFLDIDEKQVRANILPYLDYVRVPEGAADFFTIENTSTMSFLEMRIKKWKRIFIHQPSFESFLLNHLVMYCPYTNIRWSDKNGKYIPVSLGETPVPYNPNFNATFTRKCNISHVIRARKISDLIRKTKNDITHARMLGLISPERLQHELEILSERSYKLDVPVHNQEIKNYIAKTPCYRFHLYKSEEDKTKPLYTTAKKEDTSVTIKPTVLYWFIQ